MIDLKYSGRMLSGSKTSPKGHICVWNANLCIKSKGKIWYGDIDLTKDAKQLIKIAHELNEDLYVLRERDARFDNEKNPLFDNAVAIFSPDGTHKITLDSD